MTRAEVKQKIAALEREARLDTGGGMGDPGGAINALEKAIDELVVTEMRNELVEDRMQLSSRFLAILIEKHDGGDPAFDRSIAGRAVAYADDLIRTLRERRAP